MPSDDDSASSAEEKDRKERKAAKKAKKKQKKAKKAKKQRLTAHAALDLTPAGEPARLVLVCPHRLTYLGESGRVRDGERGWRAREVEGEGHVVPLLNNARTAARDQAIRRRGVDKWSAVGVGGADRRHHGVDVELDVVRHVPAREV